MGVQLNQEDGSKAAKTRHFSNIVDGPRKQAKTKRAVAITEWAAGDGRPRMAGTHDAHHADHIYAVLNNADSPARSAVAASIRAFSASRRV